MGSERERAVVGKVRTVHGPLRYRAAMFRHSVIAVGAAATIALAGCSATETENTSGSSDRPPVELEIRSPKDGGSSRGPMTTVRGTATPGAKVSIDDAAKLTDTADAQGKWSIDVYPNVGSNSYRVRARIEGHKTASEPLQFNRNRTASERARYRREKAREESNFKARATSISYAELEKSPGKHTGTDAVFTGQIAEIFEDGGEGVMRLQVTDQGYEIWTDDIWVDYEGTTSATRDDVVTVYGTMTGVKTYETQIGGERSIPEMSAKYIDE